MLMQVLVKGVELIISEFESEGPTDGFMSVNIALMFFFTVYVLETVGNGVWFRPRVRGFLSDYAYPVSMLPVKNITAVASLPTLTRSPHFSGQDSPISPVSSEQQILANYLILALSTQPSIEVG